MSCELFFQACGAVELVFASLTLLLFLYIVRIRIHPSVVRYKPNGIE